MPTIYTDGHSQEVSAEHAMRLLEEGVVEPHPGVGDDGIEPGDLKLTADADWEMV